MSAVREGYEPASCCDGPSCEPTRPGESPAPCPRCGAVGRVVGDETVRAILEPGAAARLLPGQRRFCATPACEVLYYLADGGLVEKSEARVRVGIKEREDPVPLCYCFGFSRADVRRELAATGSCTIPARIAAEVKAGRCSCEVKNPSGSCCLGEVRRAVKEGVAG